MMSERRSSLTQQVVEDWQTLLRKFKESLAKRLWAIPSVTETEKELVYRQYLVDLDVLEKRLASFYEEVQDQTVSHQEENDLLRSLLGIPEDELRSRALALNQEIQSQKKTIEELREELGNSNSQLSNASVEKDMMRRRLQELEEKANQFRSEQIRLREDDVKYYSESHQGLKNQLKDLETRLSNLRELFKETNEKLVKDKQSEITQLQKTLLDEMEAALKKRQQVVWQEEEMFAKGIAHRVRTSLVSLQGQLFLTLERLGLLDPESKKESFWKSRLKLLVEGASSLGENFKEIQTQLHQMTQTLDDYLHLTQQKKTEFISVNLKGLVDEELGEVYADRQPTLSIAVMADDPLPDVEGDRQLLKFVVSQLVRNAVEAIPDQVGQIEISIRHRPDRGMVLMTVKDTGLGIPENIKDRLFEPFLTTKTGRQGLNLSRARRYVELHNGRLELLRTGPEGTAFLVELPTKAVA